MKLKILTYFLTDPNVFFCVLMSFENLSIHLYLVVKEQKNQSINYGVDEVARNFSQNAKMDWEMDQV